MNFEVVKTSWGGGEFSNVVYISKPLHARKGTVDLPTDRENLSMTQSHWFDNISIKFCNLEESR